MPNIGVNIWCCDLEGNYSGYISRRAYVYEGYQITDDNGEVEFRIVFPGWYPGRISFIRIFQVYVSTNYSAISQYAGLMKLP